MADETLENKRIDQLPQSAGVTPGSYLAMWNAELSRTERIEVENFGSSASTQDFEWNTDQEYLEDEVVTFNGLWYQALEDNENVTPGTDDAVWLPIPKSSTGLVPWSAGVYPEANSFVMYDMNQDDADPDWGLYALKNPPTRPFVSSDFEDELTAGNWVLAAGSDAEHFKGLFASSSALAAAYPTALPGDYAYVDAGVASSVQIWSWDNDDTIWRQVGSASIVAWDSTTPGTVERSITLEAQNIVTRVAAGSSDASNSDARTPSEKGLVEMLLSFLTTAWTWTLKQTFTLAPRFSSATASQFLRVDASKDLTSVGSASATTISTGTNDTEPITALGLTGTLRDFSTLVDAATVGFDCLLAKEPKGYLETASSRTLDTTNVRGYNDAMKQSVITLIVKKTTASDIVLTLDSDFTNKDVVSDGSVSGYTLSGAINTYFKLYGLVLGESGGAIVWWNLVSAASSGIGVQDLPISAAAMWTKTTNGSADLAKTQIATSEVNIQTLDFDPTTQEFASFQIVLPRNWNNGTVFAKFYWTATGSPTGDVEWGIAGGAYSDNDALTTALGTAQVITDTFQGNDKVHITSATPAITLAGSPADGDFLFFRISRNPASGGDTLTADAKLLFVVLILTTDASTAQ